LVGWQKAAQGHPTTLTTFWGVTQRVGVLALWIISKKGWPAKASGLSPVLTQQRGT